MVYPLLVSGIIQSGLLSLQLNGLQLPRELRTPTRKCGVC